MMRIHTVNSIAGDATNGSAALSDVDRLRQQTIQFNRSTFEEPENLQIWLDFAAFQDEVFG